jgi:flagellar biosynthesis protein FliP
MSNTLHASSTMRRVVAGIALSAIAVIAFLFTFAAPASAQVAPVDPNPAVAVENTTTTTISSPATTTDPAGAKGPVGPTGPTGNAAKSGDASINLDLGSALNKPSQSLTIIILITVLSVAPALLIMLTSFTRIIIVLTLTRNALGVTSIPPNQVMTGLALFMTLFIMTPTFTAMNHDGIQPYMKGEMNFNQAYNASVKPLKTFMLKQTRKDELALFARAASDKQPTSPDQIGMNALAPAFILSEIKAAFIIGFVVFIPFLVIDIIVSSSLMAMGMMMLPPQLISLPFKILLFVLVDGWALIIKALLTSFN